MTPLVKVLFIALEAATFSLFFNAFLFLYIAIENNAIK